MWTGNTKYIYKNDLGKACFRHDMACSKYKDLTKQTQSGKGLRDKAFEVRSNPEYDGYQTGLSSMIFKFFDKKYPGGSGVATLTINLLSNLCQISYNLLMNFINQLLENLTKEKFILCLKTIFGV